MVEAFFDRTKLLLIQGQLMRHERCDVTSMKAATFPAKHQWNAMGSMPCLELVYPHDGCIPLREPDDRSGQIHYVRKIEENL